MPTKSTSQRKSVLLALGWYVQEIHKGVAKYAAEADWDLDETPSLSHNIHEGWRGDGIITIMRNPGTPMSNYIMNSKLPVVNVGYDCLNPNYPKVINDNLAIGREIAREFLSQGFEHLAFYCQGLHSHIVHERLSGFKSEVDKAGKKFYLLDYTQELLDAEKAPTIRPLLIKKLKSLPKPLAVGTQFDYDANLVVRAALEGGLSVPKEISVIGADNDPINTQYGPIPLTSIDTNNQLLGYQAAVLLGDLMDGKAPPKTPLVVPVGTIWRRRSSEYIATENANLSKALKFIDNNFNRPIDISEIARECGVSRRVLFMKFSRDLGVTPKQELLRRRIQHAKKLLTESKYKIETIALECGFNKIGAFYTAFQKETGKSPSFFRPKNKGLPAPEVDAPKKSSRKK